MQQYPVLYLNMPTTIRSFVRETAEGYTIVINPRISTEAQRNAYRHEVEHIEKGDLDSLESADVIESKRHSR